MAYIPERPHSAIDEDTIWQAKAAILEDRSTTIRQLAQYVNISVGSVEKNHSWPFSHAEGV